LIWTGRHYCHEWGAGQLYDCRLIEDLVVVVVLAVGVPVGLIGLYVGYIST